MTVVPSYPTPIVYPDYGLIYARLYAYAFLLLSVVFSFLLFKKHGKNKKLLYLIPLTLLATFVLIAIVGTFQALISGLIKDANIIEAFLLVLEMNFQAFVDIPVIVFDSIFRPEFTHSYPSVFGD